MTIGMLMESLTAKAGAVTGQFVDATPFQNSDGAEPTDPCAEYGEQLERAGEWVGGSGWARGAPGRWGAAGSWGCGGSALPGCCWYC